MNNEIENSYEHSLFTILKQLKLKIALAESCTGGLIASKIVSISGSSSIFETGVVTYSNEAKTKLLNVSEKLIILNGAVSRECAIAMAKGLLKISGADIALSVTGIAGPTGGTKEKPVGTSFIGVAITAKSWATKYHATGSRNEVREQTAKRAILFAVKKIQKALTS